MLLLTGFLNLKAQIYTVSLSGPNESPPNASPGTGNATITINNAASTMRVQCTFSGLTGTTTAAHIHAATTTAGMGTAGVATTTPSFQGFPTGVTSGTCDITLDMTLASSYNPSYVTANGGTTASAFTALKAAIAAGKAYLNIHTSTFGGGEIRGFLLPASSITNYFRTKLNGNWNNINTWESSYDNINWISATLTPDFNATSITIRNPNTVTVTANVTVTHLFVNLGSTVKIANSVTLSIK